MEHVRHAICLLHWGQPGTCDQFKALAKRQERLQSELNYRRSWSWMGVRGGETRTSQWSPGGTKPKFAFTGKKLRRKCSDLMAAFSGFPLQGEGGAGGTKGNTMNTEAPTLMDCERSQRTTSWAPSSTLNFTNQVLFTCQQRSNLRKDLNQTTRCWPRVSH